LWRRPGRRKNLGRPIGRVNTPLQFAIKGTA